MTQNAPEIGFIFFKFKNMNELNRRKSIYELDKVDFQQIVTLYIEIANGF